MYEHELNRLHSWMRGRPVGPLKAILQPTHRCNLKCVFCGGVKERMSGVDNSREMSYDDWYQVVSDCEELGVKTWWISGGGDPMIRRKITMMILERAKNLDFETEGMLTTNGTLFKEGELKQIVDIQWDTLSVSIDGCRPEINDRLRGVPGAFERATTSIGKIRDYKKKLGVEKPFIRFSSIFNNHVKDKIVEFVQVAYDVGCNGLSLNPLRMDPSVVDWITAAEMPLKDVSREEIVSQVEEAQDLAKDLGMLFEFHAFDQFEEEADHEVNARILTHDTGQRPERDLHPFFKTHCYEPFYSFIINYTGAFGPCCAFGEGFRGLNVQKTRLTDLWYGKIMQELREDLKVGKLTVNCPDCHLPFMTERFKKDLAPMLSPAQ